MPVDRGVDGQLHMRARAARPMLVDTESTARCRWAPGRWPIQACRPGRPRSPRARPFSLEVTHHVRLERRDQARRCSSLPTLKPRPTPWCGGPTTVPSPISPRAGHVSGVDVHVLVLERDRGDEVAPARQDAAGLGPLDVLAAAERDQVGALLEENPQVVRGRQGHRRVHDERQPMSCATRATSARAGSR